MQQAAARMQCLTHRGGHACSTATHHQAPVQRRLTARHSTPPTDQEAVTSSSPPHTNSMPQPGQKRRQADSTDPVASFLTRRFGLAGGLAWLGVLAVGSIGEQIKTRLEVAAEEAGTRNVTDAPEVVLPSGVSYRDITIGGGQEPRKGWLAVIDYVGKANGEVFEDTTARGKSVVFFFKSRPLTGGLCLGLEEALSNMRAGGHRIVKVPASLGFGDSGAVLRPTEHVPGKGKEGDQSAGGIPPGAELVYDLYLKTVSAPPT